MLARYTHLRADRRGARLPAGPLNRRCRARKNARWHDLAPRARIWRNVGEWGRMAKTLIKKGIWN